MIGLILSAFSMVGGFFKSLFSFKMKKEERLIASIKHLDELEMTEQARIAALSAVIVAEANSSSWLARSWRPLASLIFVGMVVSYWMGYTPDHLLVSEMPPILSKVFLLITVAMGGHIMGRSAEKVASSSKNSLPKVIQAMQGRRSLGPGH